MRKIIVQTRGRGQLKNSHAFKLNDSPPLLVSIDNLTATVINAIIDSQEKILSLHSVF